MLRVGLTGPIGAGKSTSAAWLRHLGAIVIDHDQLARQVLGPGTAGTAAVAALFPAVVADGRIDRAALGRIVFAQPAARRRLEAVVHPRVRALARQLESTARDGGAAIVVHDIPLLVETGQGDDFDYLLVVEAAFELRLGRLVERGLSPDETRRRMAAQATAAQRAAHATTVLDGSGPVERLREQLTAWWRAAVPPAAGPERPTGSWPAVGPTD
ncbi:MAG: dephospho-CoA kinase [Propionibacteriaceae bacterium]|jgi:dephospho-CoA kinase|nr:dephospho-CoA kinase [Propionibacteriaceae bacterium]